MRRLVGKALGTGDRDRDRVRVGIGSLGLGLELLLDLDAAQAILPDLEGVDPAGEVVAPLATTQPVVDALHALGEPRRAHTAHKRAVEIQLVIGLRLRSG